MIKSNFLYLLTGGGMAVGCLFSLAGLLSIPLAAITDEKEADNLCGFTVISFLICIACTILLLFGEYRVGKETWIYDNEPSAVENIVALSDNNLLSGRFYLRGGYINDDLYYQYLVELSSGGMVSNKISAKTATIYYDNNNTRVEWYHKHRNWLYFEQEEIFHKIYIPNGSIDENFNVDLN